jgi:hypothetical protein
MGLDCKAYLIVGCRFNKDKIPKQEIFEPTRRHGDKAQSQGNMRR